MRQQHSLRNATVVITDASSRIGRATALTFARQGARLVLAAPRAEALTEVAADCQQLGAEVLVVAVSGAGTAATQRLRRAATAFGGRVALWVDSAGHPTPGPLAAPAPGDPAGEGSGRRWLGAALVAGVAAGWYAWRRLKQPDDFSYYVTGGQL